MFYLFQFFFPVFFLNDSTPIFTMGAIQCLSPEDDEWSTGKCNLLYYSDALNILEKYFVTIYIKICEIKTIRKL